MNGFFKVWDSNTGVEITKSSQLLDGGISNAALNPVNDELIVQKGFDLLRVELPNMGSTTLDTGELGTGIIAYSMDGRYLATDKHFKTDQQGDDRNVLVVVDLQDNKIIKSLSHDKKLNGARFSQDGSILESMTGNVMYLWDWRNESKLAVLEYPSSGINIISDQHKLIVQYADSTIALWDFSTPYLVDKICNNIMRNLSRDEWRLYMQNIPYRETCSYR